jgi:phospholipid transport system substrate-binding protein
MKITAYLIGLIWACLAVPVDAEQDPLTLVETTTHHIIARIKQEGAENLEADPKRASALIEEYVLPHFDFNRMSQWVIGKYWREATPEQRARFTAEFRSLLVRTYAVALTKYSDQTIEFHPVNAADQSQVTVKTEIIATTGPPVPMEYRMYRRKGEWKVFDVTIDGVSLVSTYRSSFAAEIRRSGLDKLIEDLASRNLDGSTG